MFTKTNYYFKYAKNIFTQNGDDGIIEKLLKDLKINTGVVVEFGAWDGIYLSNVYNLWKNKNFKALLIEGDSNKANESLKLSENFDNVECMNCFVSPDKNNPHSLDNLLKQSSFNINNDNLVLVSIDVDSCDYHIFESLTEFSPKIIVIETKTFPAGTDINIEYHHFGQGCSLGSVTNLAESKGYKLVCHNGNAFFVRNDLISRLSKKANFSFENLHSTDEDVDVWQSIDSSGNINPGTRYYLTENYNTLIVNEKQQYQNTPIT